MDRLTDFGAHRRARALSRYWDAVVQGTASDKEAAPSADEPVEAELAELIGQLHRAWDTAPASSSHQVDDSTLTNLLATQREMITMTPVVSVSLPLDVSTHAGAYGSKTRWRLDRGATGRAAMILVASILVVSAIAVIGLLWSGRFGNDDRRDEPQIAAPSVAIEQDSPSPTSSASATALAENDELLVEVALPPDLLPAGAERSTGLAHVTIPPGVDGAWQVSCCGGPMIEYVLAGQYTVRATAAVQVVRGDGLTEDVAANMEIILRPGDALISRNETTADVANRGTEPVELLNWVLIDDPQEDANKFVGHFISGAVDHGLDTSTAIPNLTGGAVVRLHRLVLSPNERVTPPAGGLILKVTLDPVRGTIYTSRDGSFTAANLVDEPTTTVYVVTIEPV